LPRIHQAREFLGLISACAIHSSVVPLDDNTKSDLAAGFLGKRIHIHSTLVVEGKIGPFKLSSSIFPTGLEKALWTVPVITQDGMWAHSIQLTSKSGMAPLE